MAYAGAGARSPSFETCRYDGSRLLFRGPRKALDEAFIACLGGTETFGKFIARPFPDLIEEHTGLTCVNFGWPNAGIDVFANDAALLDCAARARLTVLQVPCAVNMSNMYYRVHPRRNDRLLVASEALCALYPEVDFTEFSFTRHMLTHLRDLSQRRFAYVRRELSAVWVAGMHDIMERISAPVVLLWLATRAPECGDDRPEIRADPALVSRDMLEALRADAAEIVEIVLSEGARGADPAGDCPPAERRIAGEVLGDGAHERAAHALVPVIERLIEA